MNLEHLCEQVNSGIHVFFLSVDRSKTAFVFVICESKLRVGSRTIVAIIEKLILFMNYNKLLWFYVFRGLGKQGYQCQGKWLGTPKPRTFAHSRTLENLYLEMRLEQACTYMCVIKANTFTFGKQNVFYMWI